MQSSFAVSLYIESLYRNLGNLQLNAPAVGIGICLLLAIVMVVDGGPPILPVGPSGKADILTDGMNDVSFL